MIYSLIANEKKNILLDYSRYNGNFNQVVRMLLGKIVKKGKIITNKISYWSPESPKLYDIELKIGKDITKCSTITKSSLNLPI